MSRSGQGAGRPPLASIAAGSSRPAAQLGDPGFDAQAALGLVGLGVVGSCAAKPPGVLSAKLDGRPGALLYGQS